MFALQKELDAFLRHLGSYNTEQTDITFHRGIVGFPEGTYHLIAFSLPQMGNYVAATATTRAIDVWNPRYILLGGIAGGIKGKDFELGDVVVADLIIAYEPGKVRPRGVERRPRVLRPAAVLVDAARKLRPKDWALESTVPRPDGARFIPQVRFGAVLSGEKVVTSSAWMTDVKDDLKRNEATALAEAVAVEMEAYGTALAAFQAHTAPGMLMAKGICDWADAKKNDSWQEYAADISATFLLALLRSRPIAIGVKKAQSRRIDEKPYSARSKIGLCKRMDNEWEDLADYYDIPLDERKRFRSGRECQDIWKWLENRRKLGSLPDALRTIGREDLIEELLPTSSE